MGRAERDVRLGGIVRRRGVSMIFQLSGLLRLKYGYAVAGQWRQRVVQAKYCSAQATGGARLICSTAGPRAGAVDSLPRAAKPLKRKLGGGAFARYLNPR